jgi:hypothetical protein
MSQTDVADALGLTLQQVQTNRLGAGRLQHIFQILQVPFRVLRGRARRVRRPVGGSGDW